MNSVFYVRFRKVQIVKTNTFNMLTFAIAYLIVKTLDDMGDYKPPK